MDKSPMQMVAELTREMKNMQSKLEDLRQQERQIEKNTQKEVDDLKKQRTATNFMLGSSLENKPGINRAMLLKRDSDLMTEEVHKQNDAKESIRQLREKIASLGGAIENIKREIVHYQAQAGV